MKTIQEYFSSEHDWHRIFLLAFSFFLFWVIEKFAAIDFDYKKWRHALKNSFFMLTAAPLQFFCSIGMVSAFKFDTAHHFGLFYYLPGMTNPIIQLLAALIIFDLCEYVYHVIMHKVKTLWMFHIVHHSDRVVDVSTTLREHPGETFFRLSFSTLYVFLLGAPFWVIVLRQFIQIASNVFVHANFRIPLKVDKVLSLVLVTPNFHHVHHHYKQPYTDSNYGDIFSFWDRIFGTFQRLDAKDTIFGVDTHMDKKENSSLGSLIKIPFGEYRSRADAPEFIKGRD